MSKGLCILVRTLGDVVLSGTLAKGIKAKFPNMQLDWVVEEKYKNVLDNNPDISNIITIESVGKDWDKVLKMAACDGYDEIFMFQQCSADDNRWHHNLKYMQGHLVDFYAKRCGITLSERKLFMYPDDSDRWFVDNILADCKEQVLTAIHTTTLVTAKDWQIEKFNEVVKWLRDKKVIVFQLGAESDKLAEHVIDLRGKLSFRQIAAFLSRCKMFVGLDSGISYIAGSQGIPVICIMGMSMPITSGPFGDNVTFIEPATLPPECVKWRCHSNCKFGQDKECIKTIGTDRVIEAVEKIL